MRGFGRTARADAFAAALDGQGTPEDSGSSHGQGSALLLVAQRLQQLPAAPLPRFDGAARAAVVAAAAATAVDLSALGSHSAHAASSAGATGPLTETAATSAGPITAGGVAASSGAAHALLPVLVGALATAVGVSAIGIAAHRATPGAPFYAVKQAAEAVQLDLTQGRTARAKAHLGFAAARLQEITALAGTDSSPTTTDRIGQLFTQLDGQLRDATDPLLAGGPADRTLLGTAMSQTSTTLSGLAGQLPATIQPQLARTQHMITATEALVATLLEQHPPVPLPVGSSGPGGAVPSTATRPGSGAPSAPGSNSGPAGSVSASPTLPVATPTSPGTAPTAPGVSTAPVTVPPLPTPPPVLSSAPPQPLPTTLPPLRIVPTLPIPTGLPTPPALSGTLRAP